MIVSSANFGGFTDGSPEVIVVGGATTGELVAFVFLGGWYEGLIGQWDDAVKHRAKVHKQDVYVCLWGVDVSEDEVQSHAECIIHWPVYPDDGGAFERVGVGRGGLT